MKSVQITISNVTAADVKTGKIVISGDLTLVNAAEIWEKMQGALNDFQALDVEAANITNIDLSACQIFYLLNKQSSLSEGKPVKLSLCLPTELKSLMDQSGFGKLFALQIN